MKNPINRNLLKRNKHRTGALLSPIRASHFGIKNQPKFHVFAGIVFGNFFSHFFNCLFKNTNFMSTWESTWVQNGAQNLTFRQKWHPFLERVAAQEPFWKRLAPQRPPEAPKASFFVIFVILAPFFLNLKPNSC